MCAETILRAFPGILGHHAASYLQWDSPIHSSPEGAFLLHPHIAGGERELSGASFKRALIPYSRFSRAPPTREPNNLPEAPPPNALTLGVSFQHGNFGKTQILSP